MNNFFTLTLGLVVYLLLTLGLAGCGPTRIPFLVPSKFASTTDKKCRQCIEALADGDRATLKTLGLQDSKIDLGIAKSNLIAKPIEAEFLFDTFIGRSYSRQYRVKEINQTSIEVRCWIRENKEQGLFISSYQFFGGQRRETGINE